MPHGLLVLDKPTGLSSARALQPLKRLAARRAKIGHAGTLDPFATGVLLALVGDATRLSDLVMALPKTYRATVRFGIETDTLDPEGAVVAECDPGARPPDLESALRPLVGLIDQTPPAFSALKVDGRRAYKLARAGRSVQLAPRPVRVDALAVRAIEWPSVEIEIVCGAGFYVRAFARDLGRAVALPAHLTALRRTAVGPFTADRGVAPDAVGWDDLVGPAELLLAVGVARARVEPAVARAFVAGQPVSAPSVTPGRDLYGVETDDGLWVGVGVCECAGRLRPKIVFAGARHALEGREA